jgi:hypothetical protein
MEVMAFFERSAGMWRSQRTTHHLAFRRSEGGESEITITTLAPDHPDIIDVCQLHEIDPALAVGGSCVTWQGSMAWDKESDDPHEGKTIFALVPDDDSSLKGRLLRDRGYAEIVPVVGRYEMDQDDGLILLTEYETMSSRERFWFASPNLRLRTSTVKRFGGFSTASFCTESRVDTSIPSAPSDEATQNVNTSGQSLMSLLIW